MPRTDYKPLTVANIREMLKTHCIKPFDGQNYHASSKGSFSNQKGRLVNTFKNVWNKLSDRVYRRSFAATQFKRLVPFQIRSLRKNRGWSQGQLAENSRLTQGVISRAEDSDYGNLTINTILRIADGFDVAFIGKFIPYSELDDWFIGLSEDEVKIPSFEEEDKLFQTSSFRRARRRRRHVTRLAVKPRPKAVYIDTGKEFIPSNPSGGGNQLPLQFTAPDEVHDSAFKLVNSNPKRGASPLSDLIPTPKTGTMPQMGATA